MFGYKATVGINIYLSLHSVTEIRTGKELAIILNENDKHVENICQIVSNIQHAKEAKTNISNIKTDNNMDSKTVTSSNSYQNRGKLAGLLD